MAHTARSTAEAEFPVASLVLRCPVAPNFSPIPRMAPPPLGSEMTGEAAEPEPDAAPAAEPPSDAPPSVPLRELAGVTT